MEQLRQLPPDQLTKLTSFFLYYHAWKAGRLFIPQEGPQKQAYETEASEVFYGGGVGGGKTMLAIGLSITKYHNTFFFRSNNQHSSSV